MSVPGVRVMGLDVGERRTGVAVSDELGMIATPTAVVLRTQEAMYNFRQVMITYDIGLIVAGLPRVMSGKEGQQAVDARAYASEVAKSLDLPLEFWDERLTSAMAERSLIERGVRREKRREKIDAIAAAIMLQGWLDAQAAKRARGQR